jgi:hypothetical protein
MTVGGVGQIAPGGRVPPWRRVPPDPPTNMYAGNKQIRDPQLVKTIRRQGELLKIHETISYLFPQNRMIGCMQRSMILIVFGQLYNKYIPAALKMTQISQSRFCTRPPRSRVQRRHRLGRGEPLGPVLPGDPALAAAQPVFRVFCLARLIFCGGQNTI